MKRLFITMFAALACAAITACASLGLSSAGAPAATADFSVDAGKAQVIVTAVRKLTLTLIAAKAIDKRDAQNMQDAADAGNDAIDIATAFYAEDCQAVFAAAAASGVPLPPCTSARATTKLDAAVAILNAINRYLASKGVK